MRIDFQVVKVVAKRTVKCVCGKTTQRRRTFECTINPFNRNKDGTVKSRMEVALQAKAKADAWKPGPYTCRACEEKGNV